MNQRKAKSRGFLRAAGWLFACLGFFMVTATAHAKSVAIEVEGATQEWQTRTATSAAKSTFEKLGYQIATDGSVADMSVSVSIEKAYSHHGASPTFGLLGGFIDLWNYDSGHATVTTVVREGDREVSRHTAKATKRDAPLFCWLQRAKKVRTRALSSAVKASLKPYRDSVAVMR